MAGLLVLALLLIGGALIVAGVSLPAGTAWAVLAAGIELCAIAALLSRGLSVPA